MRKIILIACLAITTMLDAQESNPLQKTISVTGSAALEIVPDEIYLQVDLREYQKKGKEKVDIGQIKNAFIQSCKDAGIADSCITVYNYEGSNGKSWMLKRKKDPEDLKTTMSYWIKLNSPAKVDELVNRLDDDATANFFIAEISHSRIIEFRKQLKIQAIKAAKEKAIYLTEAINEKIGKAITINEPSEYYSTDSRDNYRSAFNILSNSSANTNGSYESGESNSNVDFKKIKLRYEVSVVFALQ